VRDGINMNMLYRTPQVFEYDRERAVQYAHRWANSRNPAFYNFEDLGGDCTNFASQVIYAGSGVMNFSTIFGWFYKSSYDRSPSWTGVNFLYNFLTSNNGPGPFAEQVDVKDVQPGDIAQLSFKGGNVYNHSPVIVEAGNPPSTENIFVATHSDNEDNYKLTNFEWVDIRFLHIIGVRSW